jgi:fucose 4-O-acetylase-like acetyltransferase
MSDDHNVFDNTRTDIAGDKNPLAIRDARSDYLKALAIIGVVAIHAGFPYADVFRFGVPIFIAIWAFHYESGLSRRKPGQLRDYIKKRFLRLLIPYIFWSMLYVLLFRAPSTWLTTPIHTILGGWFGGYGWSGQYFFILLFQLTLLFPLLRQWVTKSSVWFVLLAGIALDAVVIYFLFTNHTISGIGDRLFVYWIPYVFLGIACARGYPKSLPWLLPFAILSLLAIPGEFNLLSATNSRISVYLLPSVVLGSVALLIALGPRPFTTKSHQHQSEPWIKKAVIYIGQHSFVIFVANPLFLDIARRLGLTLGQSPIEFFWRIILISWVISSSLILGWILRRSGLSALIGE